ncbi:MAG: ImmA/IrrE family metallo-endopeptidase [Bacillales bacterium]
MKFKVGSVEYSVTETPHILRKHDLFGQVLYDECIIEIEPQLSQQRKHNVIIHELLHACLFEAGYDEQDEEQVRRLGNVLTQVLRDNDFGFMRDEEEELEALINE